MEAFLAVSCAAVIALLTAAVLELKAIRASIDACRAMVSDAVGVPAPDLISRMTQESGAVEIPQSYRDLTRDPEEDEGDGADIP
jgi:hypothetical protein